MKASCDTFYSRAEGRFFMGLSDFHGIQWDFHGIQWDLMGFNDVFMGFNGIKIRIFFMVIPSGKHTKFANLKMAIERVDLAMKNGDFP